MQMATKRKLKNKSRIVKYDALLDLEKGESNKSVAEKYGVPKNTLSTWVKNKEKIKKAVNEGRNLQRQKMRHADNDNLDKALMKWFSTRRNENIPINGPLLICKATEYAKKLGIDDFKGSTGWLARWKERFVNSSNFKKETKFK